MKRLQSPLIVIPFWIGVASAFLATRPSWWALAGVAAWPLIEYVVHRWLMHGLEKRRPALYKRVHGVHHLYPQDLRHFTIPLAFSAPTIAIIVGLSWAGGVWPWLQPPMGGFLLAYIAYDVLHLAAHGLIDLPWMERLAQRHARHHADPTVNFGVTSSLFDRVLSSEGGQ